MEIKEERYISWSQAKKILEKKSKEKELGYEQKNALEFLRKFSKLTDKKSRDLEEELRKIERLKEKHIAALISMLPKDMDELNMLFANEVITLSDDAKKKILSLVKKHQ